MHKFQYLIRDSANRQPEAFRAMVFDDIIPRILALEPAGLKVSITDLPRPRLTVLPLRKNNLALISLWSESANAADDWIRNLPTGLVIHGYAIDESTPVAYEKDWPDGQTSPGVVLLTLLSQNPKLSYDEFMHEWHGRHTPKAIRIHPFWNYIRNVIKAPAVPGSPEFQGIVEEHFRSRADCTNPVRMFGGPLRFIPHMIEVGLHAKHFLDLKHTENYLLSETFIRSVGAR
ncbi:MAG: EthD domain-containing protein [Nevskiales bacterium]